MEITNKTKIISSIAAKQSRLGAAMHNATYQHLGVNFIYIPLTVTDCKNAIAGVKALNFRGTTVSMPHKQEVIKYLDKVDPTAQEIGAVNAVSNDGGVLTGYNSDWIGAVKALQETTDLKNKKVVLIGAGGAARAIAYGLVKNGAEVIMFNRTVRKAAKLADDFNLELGGNVKNVKNQKDYDILINATSVGFYPNESDSILDKESISEGKVVFDVVFKPIETPFLKLAKEKNCEVVPGYKMLIYQAMFQVELFTGKEAPFDVMEKALLKVL